MQAVARAKMTRTSPRKISLVAALIRKQTAEQAQVTLANTNKSAASTIATVLDAAIANAENNLGLKKANLSVESVLVGAGPTLKRMRPRSRGQGSAIMKRTSHITIILSDTLTVNRQPSTASDKIALQEVKLNEAKKSKANVSSNQKRTTDNGQRNAEDE